MKRFTVLLLGLFLCAFSAFPVLAEDAIKSAIDDFKKKRAARAALEATAEQVGSRQQLRTSAE